MPRPGTFPKPPIPMPLDILPHLSLDEMLRAAGGVALALALGGVAHRILFAVLGRLARLSASDADDLALDRIRQPALLLMLALAFALAAPSPRCWNRHANWPAPS